MIKEFDQTNLKVTMAGVESGAMLNCICTSRISMGGNLVSGKIKNDGYQVAHLKSTELTWDLSDLDLTGSQVLAGTGRMGKSIQNYDLSEFSLEITSEFFLLFRRGVSDYLLVGILTWQCFPGKLIFHNGILSVCFTGDNKIIRPQEEINLEKIFVTSTANWSDALKLYSSALAKINHCSPKEINWSGWGTWDYYAGTFGEQEIVDNMSMLDDFVLENKLIQIDDGYSVWGDWLDVREDKFPSGIAAVSSSIINNGGIAGLWLAPFVANKKSKLVDEHPDWFLYTEDGLPLTSSNSYVLDYSQNEVCAWLAEILTVMKQSWGIKYFKLDFLDQGTIPCRSAVDGITSFERFHRCFKTIQSALGNDVYILGCTAVFGTCLGYVDSIRTGPDISPQFEHIKESAMCNIGSYFLHKKNFNCDPDYLVVRAIEDEDDERCNKSNKFGTLSLDEAQLWGDFISTFGNVVIAGDKLSILRKERKKILQHVMTNGFADECFPIDLWARGIDNIPSYILSRKNITVRLSLFNWDDEPKEMKISGFTANETFFSEHKVFKTHNSELKIKLPPHSSRLLFYQGGRSFDSLSRSLIP